MATRWINSTKYEGVRWRVHPTRMHGKQRDRYFAIRYYIDGKRTETGLGWASREFKDADGNPDRWTEKRASEERNQLLHNKRMGAGPVTLKAKRDEQQAARAAEKTLQQIFDEHYLPAMRAGGNAASTIARVNDLFRLHIAPEIGELPMHRIGPLHLESIRRELKKKERAPATIKHVLGLTCAIFNFARRQRLWIGENPVHGIIMPKLDNKRTRYFTHEQANQIIAYLRPRRPYLADMAALALYTGCRLGEILSLRWGAVDLGRQTITLTRTKGKRTRVVPLGREALALLSGMKAGGPRDLVFSNDGKPWCRATMSRSFLDVMTALGFNVRGMDPKERMSFHSLRHTFASWLREAGADLSVIRDLLGHSSVVVTERYSHVSAKATRAAVTALDAHTDQIEEQEERTA